MATMTPGVLASFVHVDAATDAIRALKAQGHTDLTVYTPAPNHEIEEVLDHPVSPVRLFTLVGPLNRYRLLSGGGQSMTICLPQ